MRRRVSQCGACGAPITAQAAQCGYCGNWLEDRADTESRPGGTSLGSWLRSDAGEFGFESFTWPAVGLSVVTLLYLIGWFFEDFRYWLDTTAVVLWAVACPACLGIVAFGWRATRPTWLRALAGCFLLGMMHAGMMAMARGAINDDHIGIGAMFAGANLAGWLVGRALHHGYRRHRLRALEG